MPPKEDLVDEFAGDAAALSAIGADIRRKLAHLPAADVRELARVVARLAHAFATERIYVFGSQARGVPTANSDFDLIVVVTTSDQLPHHRAQAAYRAVGAHRIPLDILVMTREEFDARLPAVASLPATVARDGLTLYAAPPPNTTALPFVRDHPATHTAERLEAPPGLRQHQHVNVRVRMCLPKHERRACPQKRGG